MGQLGDMMYSARREAGISLAEISTVTRIRLSILEALESGQYDKLPDPGYLRGFVSDYTRHIGVDPTPFLAQLDLETGTTRVSNPMNHRTSAKVRREPNVSTRQRPHEVQLKPLLILLGAIAALALVVWLGYSLWPKSGSVSPAPDGSSSQSSTSTPTTAKGAPFTLEIKVADGGASEVYLIVDKLVAFDQSLASTDEPLIYDVVQEAVITATNPDMIEVYINGTAVPVEKADTPVTLTAPAEE